MVYIGTTSDDGRALYFDVYATERSATGVRICGTIGDGQYEGEVLVELGALPEVTFADAWLGDGGFREFLTRCNVQELRADLLRCLETLPLLVVRQDQPHPVDEQRRADLVCEIGPLWQAVA